MVEYRKRVRMKYEELDADQIKSNQVYLNTTFLKKTTQGCLQDT